MPTNGLQPQMMPANAGVPRANWNNPTMGMGTMGMPGMPNQMGAQQLPGVVQIARPALSGKVVNSLEEITVQDVPQDGTASFFPTADYSCIFAKQWGNNGLINTVKYVPERVEESAPSPDLTAVILQRLDNIEKMLKKNGRNTKYNKPVKKEEENNADA